MIGLSLDLSLKVPLSVAGIIAINLYSSTSSMNLRPS
jgi:hypothetical protein